MGITTILALISFVIQYGPALVAAVIKIWNLIHHPTVSAADRPGLLERLSGLARGHDLAGLRAMLADLQARTGAGA